MPADLNVHLILDNYVTHKTPAVKQWLQAHPRFHLHSTPTSASWLNGSSRTHAEEAPNAASTAASRPLKRDIRAWLADWNQHPRPFLWTKTADEILNKGSRRISTHVTSSCGRR